MAFQNLKSTGIAYLLGKLKTVFLQIKDAVKSVNGVEPDEDGDIQINSVPYAKNLESESSQKDFSTFIQRTAGGTASIQTGDAWLMGIKGNNIHDGYVPEVLEMDVNGDNISATIDRDTFVGEVSESGTITLTYTSGSWSTTPATYGVTVTGTPANGDTIVITYVKEERGTIIVSDPQSLIATGWNLYDKSNGYARVVKYSDEYAFMIEGTYSAVKFSATVDGTKTDVTVTDGNFDPFANSDAETGYVWVTSGDDSDVAIWMTWSDWADGHDGEFADYTESEVDFSSVMESYFPYGLLKAGSVQDEIDFNLKQAISRVERMAYSAENRAAAEASGREYEFDEDFIYLARTSSAISQNTHTITVSGAISVDDHGLEIITGTDIPVDVQMLYGNNLANKLERDVLTISSQNLTSAQQAQVQQNLGIDDLGLDAETVESMIKFYNSVYLGGSASDALTKINTLYTGKEGNVGIVISFTGLSSLGTAFVGASGTCFGLGKVRTDSFDYFAFSGGSKMAIGRLYRVADGSAHPVGSISINWKNYT